MASAQAPVHLFYFAMYSLVGEAADTIMHLYQDLRDEKEQHIMISLCSNLYRAEARLAKKIRALGYEPDKLFGSLSENLQLTPHQTEELAYMRKILSRSVVKYIPKDFHSSQAIH